MSDPYSDASLSFHFLNLNKLQAITLSREVFGATYTSNTQHDGYVGSVPLLAEQLDNVNMFYVRQQIKLNDCDILVVVSSATNRGKFVTPEIVNQLQKHIDCRLTFSFSLNEPG